MEKLLKDLGWKDKEIRCYLALLELGQQPASVLSKRLHIPKATVLFVLHRLHKKGIITMSKKGKTEYFFADPEDLKQTYSKQLRDQHEALEKVVPLLHECKNPLTSPPKVTFFEGVEPCKSAYAKLLESTTDILEFATHDDLVDKFGEQWMDDFVHERARRNIFIHSICHDSPMDRAMLPLDEKQLRKTKFIPEKKGHMYSCMAIYEDKLLMLNLSNDAFGILIENSAIVETMKVIHSLAWTSRSFR